MTTPACAKCRRQIQSADVNVALDIAYCRSCNLSHSFADLTRGKGLEPNDNVLHPPAGAWCRRELNTLVIGATHRALVGFLGSLLICLFWNGIVSCFVLLALSSTLHLLGISAPDWFPEPRMNGDEMRVGVTLGVWLFLSPFIIIGLAMLGATLSYMGGRSEVRLAQDKGVVFMGIGPIGRRRRFKASSVMDVHVQDKHWTDSEGNSKTKSQIVLTFGDGKEIRFGSSLKEERREFVAAALLKALKIQ